MLKFKKSNLPEVVLKIKPNDSEKKDSLLEIERVNLYNIKIENIFTQ
jgi:hypothetical protein